MVKLTLRIYILIIVLILALLMISPKFTTSIIVKEVKTNSTSYNQGIRAGMVIQEFNSKPIKSIEDYTSAVTETFSSGSESRVEIKADNQDFVFFATNISEINVESEPSTKIKTGLDLSGGIRAVLKPANVSLSDSDIQDLVDITSQRLNAFGVKDISVRSTKDLQGNNFMVVEVAGASSKDIIDLLGSQGKFEAKIGNQTVFEGGNKDISDVCRSDASCSAVTGCFPAEGGYACNFQFAVYLREEAAKKHADITRNLSLDQTGKYLSEKLYLYVDNNEVDSLLISSGLRGQTTTQISIQGSGSGVTQDEAVKQARIQMNKLQTILLTGSLPYKLEIVKLDTISPTLGKEFSRSIFLLGILVFIIVSLAIFVKYRKIKITLAVILTMFSEVFITLGIAALIKWNLDAPSIAGIIAGIGTGVNDQIVIIDESVSDKANNSSSIKERIKRALFIIVGAFLTIVAAMIPLFWAGAGLLRGFALTTIIGVSVGILVTRPAFADMLKKIEA